MKAMHKLFANDFADEIYGKKEKKQGVTIKQSVESDNKVSWVVIDDDKNVYEKDIGNYITIETKDIENDDATAKILAKNLKKIIKKNKISKTDKVLVVGLGNDRYLSDALGPKVIKDIKVTSHVVAEKKATRLVDVSCLVPGVMAATGMESSNIIKSIVKDFDIKLVIVVDSLATRSVKRLYKTFQISDTGISPGSGVNNKRKAISFKTMGVPVVAIGVATVVDSASIVANTLSLIDEKLPPNVSYEIIQKVLAKKEHNLVMTSKEIDRIIGKIAHVISSSINLALNPSLMQKAT